MSRNWRADDIIEMVNLEVDPEAVADLHVDRSADGPRAVRLAVEAENHRGVLARVASAIARCRVNISDCSVLGSGSPRGWLLFAIDLEDPSELELVGREVGKVEGVFSVGRVAGRQATVGRVARTGVDHEGRTWAQMRTGQTLYPDSTPFRNLTIEAEQLTA